MAKRRTKVKLGRLTTPADHKAAGELCDILNIDKRSGIGYRGLVKSGEIKPRPYLTNHDFKKNYKNTWNREIPIKLFAGHADHVIEEGAETAKVVAFCYSELNYKNYLYINLDTDNKFGLSKEDFAIENQKLLNILGMSEVYTQDSTKFGGLHNYFQLIYDYWSAPKDELTFEIRETLNNFQSYVRKLVKQHNLKMHIDILGWPCVYADDGSIIKRGNWVKLPFYMNDPAEKQKLISAQQINLQDLQALINDTGEVKEVQVDVAKEIPVASSNFTSPTWEIRELLIKKFYKIYNTTSLPMKKGILTDKEFCDYCMAIEMSSKMQQNQNSKKPEHLKDTNPMASVKGCFNYNRDAGSNLQVNVWDDAKAAHVRKLLEAHGVIHIIDEHYTRPLLNASREVLKEGIAAKWKVQEGKLQEFADSSSSSLSHLAKELKSTELVGINYPASLVSQFTCEKHEAVEFSWMQDDFYLQLST